MEKISDALLYERVRGKDKAALEELYDRYEKMLFSYLCKMTGDRDIAEEALQEVFVKIWRGTGTYHESKGKFVAWLVTMSRNAAVDLIRKQKKPSVPLDEVAEVESTETSVEETVEVKEKREQIHEAVRHLSDEQQKMVDLFYFKGYTHETIAEKCGIPLGTVKSRIRLALKKLKTSLHMVQEGGVLDDKREL
ncbi:RNA polymerase sigma factor [Planococcus dechangensis]|uniref:RNA polymerase sigma factor n=1 Tax=Planococcus dechangensis TaxID=1176255 RepID=A0ABV9ME73_9BACL